MYTLPSICHCNMIQLLPIAVAYNRLQSLTVAYNLFQVLKLNCPFEILSKNSSWLIVRIDFFDRYLFYFSALTVF